MKNRVKDAAAVLFNEKGFEQTSLQEIEEYIKITNIAEYFSSKEEILVELVTEGIKKLEYTIQSSLRYSYSPNVIALDLVKGIVTQCGQNQKIVEVVMNVESTSGDENFITQVTAAKNRLIKSLSEAISYGKREYAVRDCNSEATAEGIVSFLYTFTTTCLKSGMTDLNQIAQSAYTLLMKGVLR